MRFVERRWENWGSCVVAVVVFAAMILTTARANDEPTSLVLRLPAPPLLAREVIRVQPSTAPSRVGWCEATSPHYHATAHLAPDETAAMLIRLEDVHALLTTLLADFPTTGDGREKLPLTIFRDRAAYLRAMVPKDPNAGVSWGFYSSTERRIFLFPPPLPTKAASDFERRYVAATLLHEATHQFLHQRWGRDGTDTNTEAGRDRDFWVTEGIACYIETLQRETLPTGDDVWTLGAWESDRMRAACVRLDQEFFVPLERLAAMGNREFMEFLDVRPLYSQSAGMTAFLVATHRDAFWQYLHGVETGTGDIATLVESTGQTLSDLDAAYKRLVHNHIRELKSRTPNKSETKNL